MKLLRTHKILLLIAAILFVIAAVMGLSSCTAREEANAKKAGGVVAGLFGLPPGVGESLVAIGLAITHTVTAKVSHRRGTRCQVRPPTPPASA